LSMTETHAADLNRTVLSIDTSGPILGLALVENGELRGHREDRQGMRHTENLLPVIEMFLTERHITGPLGGVAVARGPGSFTGLRIAMATAKALGLAWQCPVVSVGTLHSMAETERLLRLREGKAAAPAVMPVLDARKQRYYTAVFVPDPATGALKRATDDLDVSMVQLQYLAESYPGVCLPGPDDVTVSGGSAAVAEGISGAVGAGVLGARLIGRGVQDDPYAGPHYLRTEDIGVRKKGPRFRSEP